MTDRKLGKGALALISALAVAAPVGLVATAASAYVFGNVRIEGNADERGTREYNIALGDRRANAVKNYLVSMGVSAARVNTISYGKERPAVVGTDAASWAQNRRGVTTVQ